MLPSEENLLPPPESESKWWERDSEPLPERDETMRRSEMLQASKRAWIESEFHVLSYNFMLYHAISCIFLMPLL